MPTVKYVGREPTRSTGLGMLIRNQPLEVSQADLDLWRHRLPFCEITGDANASKKAVVEEKTVDEGNDGLPDKGWTRADIVSWLKDKGVQTRAGLTKAQLLTKVEETLNPTEESDEATGSDE